MSDPAKVSVICPVYNVEPWLPECLDSLLAQSLTAWEAILVIDGATDKSGAIADRYAAQDPRFRVVYQDNAGQGAARNKGAQLAVAPFLFFLDPDDVVPPHALQVLYDAAIAKNADVVIGDVFMFQDGTPNAFKDAKISDYFIEKFSALPDVFTRKDIADFDFFYNSLFFMVVWMKLFRTETWRRHKIEAPTGLRMGEDFMTVKKMCLVAERITTVKDVVIYYRKRKKSATTKRSAKAFDMFKAYELVADMYRQIGVSNREWTYLHRACYRWYWQHLKEFTPRYLWYKFYRRMIASIKTWDIESFDPEAIPPDLVEKLRLLQTGEMLKFLFTRMDEHRSYLIKHRVVKALRFIKRHLPDFILLPIRSSVKFLSLKIKNPMMKVTLEKIHSQLASH